MFDPAHMSLLMTQVIVFLPKKRKKKNEKIYLKNKQPEKKKSNTKNKKANCLKYCQCYKDTAQHSKNPLRGGRGGG